MTVCFKQELSGQQQGEGVRMPWDYWCRDMEEEEPGEKEGWPSSVLQERIVAAQENGK